MASKKQKEVKVEIPNPATGDLPIVPVQPGSAKAEPEIAMDVKVSKAEMTDILIVNIQQQLYAERKAIELKLDASHTTIAEEQEKIYQALMKKLEPKLKPLRAMGLVPQFKRGSNEIRATYGKPGVVAYTVRCDLNEKYLEQTNYNDASGIFEGVEIVCRGFKLETSAPASAALLELQKVREAILVELKEVDERIDRARDTRLIKAQLNTGILASMKNGKQMVQNMAKMSEHLVQNMFKKDTPPALVLNVEDPPKP